MDYTKSLTNTSVPVGKLLALGKEFEKISGQFFDEKGNMVDLNLDKYNKVSAVKFLSNYIPNIN